MNKFTESSLTYFFNERNNARKEYDNKIAKLSNDFFADNNLPFKVGDKVIISGYGNGSSYGDSVRAGGIGWQREILKIYPGRRFPYQVGNSTGTTGFYEASALKKI